MYLGKQLVLQANDMSLTQEQESQVLEQLGWTDAQKVKRNI